MSVRTLIVDDEPLARRFLCSMVAGVEWLELVGTADCGTTAARLIDEQEPDLVLLDIRLPDISGIELAEAALHRPEFVFTTAYDEFAIRALQLGAVDYLVKPFGAIRFREAADRVRTKIDREKIDREGKSRARLTPGGTRSSHSMTRIYVRDRGLIVPVLLQRVERIEAQGDYCLLCTETRRLLALIGIGELEASLDPDRFVRIHRSHIVNLDFVVAFRPLDARRFGVSMKSGVELTASGAGSRTLRALIR
jgi:two-component system LytT family response regulator